VTDRAGEDVVDLAVVGGGVMGLFTAYQAAAAGARVTVLEAGRIGDPRTASYGRTRSYRRDYLDARYVRLADEAMRLWTDFERDRAVRALVRCGCMNIAAKSVTPDLDATYGRRSTAVMRSVGVEAEVLDGAQVDARFGYLRADEAHLDPAGGVVDLAAVTGALLSALAERRVTIREEVDVVRIVDDGKTVEITTDGPAVRARALVITAGHGTNDVLRRLEGCTLQIPLTRDRPSEAKYFVPDPADRAEFTADRMPVIAYLDTGIYVHPIVDGVVDAVKIGYYNPPDVPRGATTIADIAEFVGQCMPGLRGARVTDVLDVDQCDYDLVADDEFVLGLLPGQPNIAVGVGWRGTGYKFAPLIGRVLSQLALKRATEYDISRFAPGRFGDNAGELGDKAFLSDEVH
jgi:glycine/D-amino acid oxidase-like deaminating enzyme